jgi:hypothetical protein
MRRTMMIGFDSRQQKRQNRMVVTKDTQVEEVVKIKGVISYFIQRGVSPISCSGAFPQSLGNLLSIKKVADPDAFIEGLNEYIASQSQELKDRTDD